MKNTLFIFLLSLLSIAAFAQNTEVKAAGVCFGFEHHGSNGEWEACQKTSNNINSLSTDALKVNAKCVDVRGNGNEEERVNSGCVNAAFVIKSTVTINKDQAAIENKSTSYSCQEADSSAVPPGLTESQWLNDWKSSCLNGTSTFAIKAKNRAVETAVTLCLEKGFSNCAAEKATTKYKYYFFSDPRCVATAVIRN